MTGHEALGPGQEFDAIRALVDRWGSRAVGIGDDAAILDVPPGERLVVSTDTSVENVHFRREWLSPEEIGWRATMAALSDLAAMAARPLGVLSVIAVPPAWRGVLSELGDGIGAAAAEAGAPIVGGDLSGASELSLTITALGAVAKPLMRGGARAGDALWVTGTLGGPALALRSWLAGEEPPPAARARFAHPQARIAHALWLAEHGARAGIDVSDGLAADAQHLAAASVAALDLTFDTIPAFEGVSRADAAASGEEYELLVAAPPELDARAFAHRFALPLTRVGVVREAMGTPVVAATDGGARVELPRGYDHFLR